VTRVRNLTECEEREWLNPSCASRDWMLSGNYCFVSCGGLNVEVVNIWPHAKTTDDTQISISSVGDCRRDRVVVGFTTTCATSDYHH